MFALAFMLFGENPLEPMRLMLGGFVIRHRRLVKNYKFLAATITAKRAHFQKAGGSLPCLTLLDCDCFHR